MQVGLVAIDGTGICANANMDRVCDADALAEEARRLLAEAEAEDAREDALSQDEQTSLRGLLPAGGLESRSRWSVAHEPDQFDSLAIGQASDRLRRRDPALAEPTRRPHRADLR